MWLYDDFTPGGGGATPGGKRRLIRGGGGGGGLPPGSVVRLDPGPRWGGGGVQHGSPFPGKELLHSPVHIRLKVGEPTTNCTRIYFFTICSK